MPENTNSMAIFLKYNITAFTATAVDFLVLICFTEVFGLWYLFSAIVGSTTGGITAFLLERNWTFKKRDGNINHQAKRFVIVWVTSIVLNTALLYMFVEFITVQYIISRIIVAVIVGIGFNFITHKYYIFK